MGFKNLKKHPQYDGKYTVEVGAAPIKEFTMVDIKADIKDHEAAIAELEKLKIEVEALIASP